MKNINIKGSFNKIVAFLADVQELQSRMKVWEVHQLLQKVVDETPGATYFCTEKIHFVDLRKIKTTR